nr:retrovirus-related Pol polyprotein from transposon TNT 1-94 [Tanacetum cinerariifolium]
LRIGRSNFRLPSDIQSKEATLQVVYDVLRNSPLFKAFQITADVPEIYMQEFWATAKLHHTSIRFKIDTKKRSDKDSNETVKSGAGKEGDKDDDEDNDDDDEEKETVKDDEEDKETGKGGDEVRKSGGESEEEEETSEEEEGSFDPIPRTPEDSEKESDDEEEQESRLSEEARIQEEKDAKELYRDVNINQGRGLQVTQNVEDTHVILTPVNPDDPQEKEEESFDPIPRTPKESVEESNNEEDQDLRISEEERIQEEEDADELYRDVNINQGRGLQVTQNVEDTHVTLTPVNPDGPQEKAVATACFTQNRSIIRLHHGKTPYELKHDKQPDLSYFHVFGALCYPTNDGENVEKLQPKADIGFFFGYTPTKKAFRIYNRRTRRIVETIHVDLMS